MPATSFNVPVGETLRGRVADAARVLSNGGVVAIPTDTVYGLAVAYDDEQAVERLFRLKSRPLGLPVPLLLDHAGSVECYVTDIPDVFWDLAEAFWPGPLTMVLPKSDAVPNRLTGGRDTVGLRVPDHWLPRCIVESLDRAITGTSANLSGLPPLTTAQSVEEHLGNAVDLVIDGGPASQSTASTVVDLSGNAPTILRKGRISAHDIEFALRAT